MLSEEEELRSIRPDLDGNEIMELLGIGPGRDVGTRTSSCSNVAWIAAPSNRMRLRLSCFNGGTTAILSK